MNLEQAIKRTEAVIGLPEHSDASIGFAGICLEWSGYGVEVDGEQLPDSAAFALLRDHAQAACDERGWAVLTQGYQLEPAEMWMINAYEVRDCFGDQIGFGETRLDAMLTALEKEQA